jgi:sarcosine oxidase gamma subunit
MSAPVVSIISESTLPPLPIKQETLFDGSRRVAVTVISSIKPKERALSMSCSIDLAKTRRSAFCAGECDDSRFSNAETVTRRSSELVIGGAKLIEAPV